MMIRRTNKVSTKQVFQTKITKTNFLTEWKMKTVGDLKDFAKTSEGLVSVETVKALYSQKFDGKSFIS